MQWLCNESYSIIVRLKVISFVLLFGLSLWGLYFILDCCWKVYCPGLLHTVYGGLINTSLTQQEHYKLNKNMINCIALVCN